MDGADDEWTIVDEGEAADGHTAALLKRVEADLEEVTIVTVEELEHVKAELDAERAAKEVLQSELTAARSDGEAAQRELARLRADMEEAQEKEALLLNEVTALEEQLSRAASGGGEEKMRALEEALARREREVSALKAGRSDRLSRVTSELREMKASMTAMLEEKELRGKEQRRALEALRSERDVKLAARARELDALRKNLEECTTAMTRQSSELTTHREALASVRLSLQKAAERMDATRAVLAGREAAASEEKKEGEDVAASRILGGILALTEDVVSASDIIQNGVTALTLQLEDARAALEGGAGGGGGIGGGSGGGSGGGGAAAGGGDGEALVSVLSLDVGNIALFVPKGSEFTAFNLTCHNYFLAPDCKGLIGKARYFTSKYVIGNVLMIQEYTTTAKDKYGVPAGTKIHLVSASVL
eukprot:PLAT12539.49.p1 GENE.PLAT12539.49~~PLAT12539.49.p1  ORF type:complete len:420 (-),score=238.42 PLAT12539.49:78-1337(-)